MYKNIGFIGTGNMGGTIAKVVYSNISDSSLYLSDHSAEKLADFAKLLPGSIQSSNIEIAEKCSLIFLAVKPQVLPAVLKEIAPVLMARKDRFVIASMAAGTTIDKIVSMIGIKCPVIRMMPNTPVSVAAGVIQYCYQDTSEEDVNDYIALLENAGTVDYLPENLIDAACALSGSGPAYAYTFIDALADGAVACGLPRENAIKYAAQMVEGAAKMVRCSGQHPDVLKDAVCSPGGTTIEGVRALEEAGFRGAVIDAILAGYMKAKNM